MNGEPFIPDDVWTTDDPTPARVRIVRVQRSGYKVVIERLTGRRKGYEVVVSAEQLRAAFHPETLDD